MANVTFDVVAKLDIRKITVNITNHSNRQLCQGGGGGGGGVKTARTKSLTILKSSLRTFSLELSGPGPKSLEEARIAMSNNLYLILNQNLCVITNLERLADNLERKEFVPCPGQNITEHQKILLMQK